MSNGGWAKWPQFGYWWILPHFVLMASIFVAGCTTAGLQPKKDIPKQKAQDILEALAVKEASIRTLKGLFRVSIAGSILPVSKTLPGVVFYTRPDSIRLKGFTPVGGTFFQFVRVGEDYRLMLPTSGRFTTGKIQELGQAGDMGHVVELSLRAMDAVLGKIDGLNFNEVQLSEEDRGFRIDIQELSDEKYVENEVVMTRMWVDKQSYDIVHVEYLDGEGDLLLSIDCQDFRTASSPSNSSEPAIQLPFSISAEDDRLSGSVTLKFQEIVANAEL